MLLQVMTMPGIHRRLLEISSGEMLHQSVHGHPVLGGQLVHHVLHQLGHLIGLELPHQQSGQTHRYSVQIRRIQDSVIREQDLVNPLLTQLHQLPGHLVLCHADGLQQNTEEEQDGLQAPIREMKNILAEEHLPHFLHLILPLLPGYPVLKHVEAPHQDQGQDGLQVLR